MASEEKNEKFKRLAEARVSKAIKTIRLISNLANRNNYDYTDEQADKIIAALNREVRTLKDQFKGTVQEDDVSFRL